jgi:hypothetical protein
MTIFGLIIIIIPTGISSSNNNNSTSKTDGGRVHMGGSVNMDMKLSKSLNTSRQ